MPRWLACLPVCLLLASSSWGQLRPRETVNTAQWRVAVWPPVNNGGKPEHDWIGPGLADVLTGKLSRLHEMQVVERAEIRRLVAEKDLGLANVTDGEALAQVKLTGANVAVLGGYTVAPDGQVLVASRFVSVATGEVLRSAEARGKTDQVFELADELAFKLAEALGKALPPEQREVVRAEVPTEDRGAFQQYAEAQVLEQRGERDEAERRYRVLVEEQPEFLAPREQLARSASARGDAAESRRLWEEQARLAAQSNRPRDRGTALLEQARLAWQQRDAESAVRLYSSAERAFKEARNLYGELRVHVEIQPPLVRLGDKKEALRHAVHSLRVAAFLGLKESIDKRSRKGRGEPEPRATPAPTRIRKPSYGSGGGG